MKSGNQCGVCKVAAVLAGLGALNWGLVAFAGVNLVERILGMGGAAKAAYAVIAIAGLLTIGSLANICPCSRKS